MILGFQFYMFQVRYAVCSKSRAEVEKCAMSHGRFVVLENEDELLKLTDPNQQKMIYTFLGGKKDLTRHRYLVDRAKEVRSLFDLDKFEKAKGFVIPPFKEDELPLPVKNAQMAARAAKVKEHPIPEVYMPANRPGDTDTADEGNSAGTADTEQETDDMATKRGKKSTTKTAAKKATKKASNGAGRKSAIPAEAKLRAKAKENPYRAEHNGKPSKRHKCYDIIAKNPGITYEDFIKKGGNSFDLNAFIHHYESVSVTGA